MRKPKGLLQDIFELPTDEDGKPRSVLVLNQLTHIPTSGDVLRIAKHTFIIAQADHHRTRDCLTGRKSHGRGSIGILINEPYDKLRPFVPRTDPLWVTWTPKDELPSHFGTNDLPTFRHLNEGWNADPKDVDLKIKQLGQTLFVCMNPNLYLYNGFENTPDITIYFEDCARYRVTPMNDHGWYLGQCRFSRLAPEWGEFYEVSGNTRDDLDPTPWIIMGGNGSRHFHFYLRDETLEVKAQRWTILMA